MEAHLAPKSSVQVNKITFSCEICSGPHDTKYCMENPGQAFIDYASSRTDEAGNTRLSKFEAVFKQQQSEMTNKIDTFLKAINDQMVGALPSDTDKNPKLSVYPTSLVSFAHSYLVKDPQSSSHPLKLVNANKTEWEITRDAELNPFNDVLVFRKMVELLGAIPINLMGNMWESEELIEKKIDWNKPPKERDELKDLTSLSLDELIRNLKVQEMIIKKDSEIVKAKRERKTLTLTAKKESSDDECLTSGSDDKEYTIAVRDFKNFFKRSGRFVRQPWKKTVQISQDDKNGNSNRKCFRCSDLNHLIRECQKPPKDNNQRAFVESY
nr:alpha/beta hydrolases superfamily protein [Tanacetum cinerariifolium]